jgi:glycosyltransferase involved in cell wall biosynthesis
MRLLVLCDYQPNLLDGLFDALDLAGAEDRVLIRKDHGFRWRDAKSKVIDLSIPVTHEESGISLSSVAFLVSYILKATVIGIFEVIRYRLDAVLGVYAFPQGVVATVVAVITRRNLVIATDGGDVDVLMSKPLIRGVILACLRRANVVTALNRSKANMLLLYGIRSLICPTVGVNASRFPYRRFETKQKTSLLFVGRLIQEKRPFVLIRACSRLHLKGIPFKLTIVGDGVMRDQISMEISKFKLENYVELAGALPHSKVHRFFASCGIFILPSSREGVSVALLEAMSSGCLCIVSDIADNLEIIRNGYSGYTFHTDSDYHLSKQLETVINEESARIAKITARAKQIVMQNYSSKAVADSLHEAFRLCRK